MKTEYLYRYFDENENLLYVGISLHVMNRVAQHKNNSKWFAEVHSMTFERCESRQDAANKEIVAIKNERPIYNRAHVDECNLHPSAKEEPNKVIENPIQDATEKGARLIVFQNRVYRGIRQGKIRKVTYRMLKKFGLTSDRQIQSVQYNLLRDNLVVRNGSRFVVRDDIEIEPSTRFRFPMDDTDRKAAKKNIITDIESGKLRRLTYGAAKCYGSTSDADTQYLQKELVKSGHLMQKGRMFISTFDQQKAA